MTEVFGSLLREKRLGLGLSLGQLASQVSRTAATVRAWERGERVPDAATIRKLASVLAADGAELQAAADGAAPSTGIDESEDTETVADYAIADHTATGAGTVAYVASGNGSVEGGVAIDGPVVDEIVQDTPLVDLPTEAVRVVAPTPDVAPTGGTPAGMGSEETIDTATDAPTAPQGNELQQAIAAIRKVYNTIFDPEKRYLYWIRGVLLLLGLYVLLRVGRDATSGLLQAFGDFLDTFGRGEKPDSAVNGFASFSGLI